MRTTTIEAHIYKNRHRMVLFM